MNFLCSNNHNNSFIFLFLKINNRLNSRCFDILVLEKKGFARVLLLLYDNQNSIDSKYKLKKLAELSNTSLNECLNILKKQKLINIKKDIGPRNRTELKLTELGIKIAQSLKEILILLNDTKTN